MPDYYLLNLYAGYHFYIKDRRIDLRGSLNNITDLSYISDASDNNAGSVDTFNAASATVYAGLGFRWMFSVTATF
jgi:outer membrane receptor protein involved in Fe transport